MKNMRMNSRAARAGLGESKRPTKGNARRPPKSDAHQRGGTSRRCQKGSCYFLPFFFLALPEAGGSRLSSRRCRLSSRRCRLSTMTDAGLAARQLAKKYLRRHSLGEPLLLEFFTTASLNRQTKAWKNPAAGQGVGSLLVALLPDAVTGGSPTRPWSVKGVGSASNLRFAVPQLSPLLSAKSGEAMPKVAGAVFPAVLAPHSRFAISQRSP